MGFLMPKVPAMPAIPAPQPLPEPPKAETKDPVRQEEVKDKRALIRRNKKGRSSTILTTADGLEDNELTTKKKLLGG
tara:strand:- start:221 stop:451 length:231 start_codon:yes stop_codon:yes gene_type:complete